MTNIYNKQTKKLILNNLIKVLNLQSKRNKFAYQVVNILIQIILFLSSIERVNQIKYDIIRFVS